MASEHWLSEQTWLTDRRSSVLDIAVTRLGEVDRVEWEELFRAYMAFYETTLTPDAYDRAWAAFRQDTVMHAGGPERAIAARTRPPAGCQACVASMLICQLMAYLSVSVPNVSPQNCFSSGESAVPSALSWS